MPWRPPGNAPPDRPDLQLPVVVAHVALNLIAGPLVAGKEGAGALQAGHSSSGAARRVKEGLVSSFTGAGSPVEPNASVADSRLASGGVPLGSIQEAGSSRSVCTAANHAAGDARRGGQSWWQYLCRRRLQPCCTLLCASSSQAAWGALSWTGAVWGSAAASAWTPQPSSQAQQPPPKASASPGPHSTAHLEQLAAVAERGSQGQQQAHHQGTAGGHGELWQAVRNKAAE